MLSMYQYKYKFRAVAESFAFLHHEVQQILSDDESNENNEHRMKRVVL